MSRPLTLGEAEAKAEAENTLQEAKRATAAAQRERWRRPPVADGNLHLPAGRTSTLGLCQHCALAIRLAFNEDAGEYTVAHEYPVCGHWLGRGVVYLGKPTTMPVCPECGAADCIGCVGTTR